MSAGSDKSDAGWWACQHEHPFRWGDEEWHDRDTPSHCQADWSDCGYARHFDMVGHPCMDSSVLMGPHDSPEAAVAAVRSYKARGMWRADVGTPTFNPHASTGKQPTLPLLVAARRVDRRRTATNEEQA